MAYLLDQEGKLQTVPDVDVDFLRARGWSEPSPEVLEQKAKEEKYSGVGNAILNVATTAAGDILPGLPALAAKMGTGIPVEELKAMHEARPQSEAVLGHILGYGLPAVATMGGSTAAQAAKATLPSLVSAAGRTVAQKLGGGLAAKTAGAAVEGGLVAGADLLNEASLGDPVLNAENIVSHPDVAGKYMLEHLLEGTVMGGVMGGTLGLAGHGVSKAIEKVADSEVMEGIIKRLRMAEPELYAKAAAGGKKNPQGVVSRELRKKSLDQVSDMARNMGPKGLDLLHGPNGFANTADEVLESVAGAEVGVSGRFEEVFNRAQPTLEKKWGVVPLSIPQDEAAVGVLDGLENAANDAVERAARTAAKTSAADTLAKARLNLAEASEKLRLARQAAQPMEAAAAPSNPLRDDAIKALEELGWGNVAESNVDRALAALGEKAKDPDAVIRKALTYGRDAKIVRGAPQKSLSPEEYRALVASGKVPPEPVVKGGRAVSPEVAKLQDEVTAARKEVLEARAKAIASTAEDRSAQVASANKKAQDALDELAKARQGMAKRAADVSAKNDWALDNLFGQIRKDIVDPLRKAPEGAAAADAVEEFLAKVEAEYPTGTTLRELHALRQSADTLAYGNLGTQDPLRTVKAGAYYDLRDAISKELGRRLEEAGVGNLWKSANRDWATLKFAKALAVAGTAGDFANNSMPLVDVLGGMTSAVASAAMGGGLPGAGLKGLATAAAMRAARRNYPALAGRAAGSIADTMARIDTLKMWNSNTLADAAGRVLAAGRQATVASALEEAPVQRSEKRAGRTAEAAQEQFRKRVDSIRSLQDPALQSERLAALTQEWRDHAPQTATMAQALMAKQIAFLLSKLPPLPPRSLMQEVSGTPPTYGSATMARFNRYYSTALDPLTALEAAAQGALMKEHLETLDSVWPAQKQQMVRHLTEAVASSGGNIPSRSRGSLGLLLARPVRQATPLAMQLLYHPPQSEPPKPNPKAAGLTQAARNSLHPNPGPKGR